MDTYNAQAQLFKALMHPARLAILDELRNGEQCVCHMEAKFGLRQAYISQHLMLLRDVGLVTMRRDGWNKYYSVTKPEVYHVVDAMGVVAKMVNKEKRIPIEPESWKSAEQHPCPCPKCNPGLESSCHESLDLAAGEVQAEA